MSEVNKQLLYILPEMAFTSTLQETPKRNYFFVKSFHQVNGQFLDDDNFIFENLKKLFERIDPGEYTLVLPDFLFTDTIVSVPETEDMAIAEYLRDELLPRIEVSTFSHETRTSVLLQRGKNSKVQLSAFEKELGAVIRLAIGSYEVKVKEVVPLSWTLKAAVSLEPSVTIAQIGERLYLAEHFVGINQTENAKLTEINKIGETIKTLKGADPNLQTVYLLTSDIIEEKLQNLLMNVLPIQQLTELADGEMQIPSHLKQIIEVAGRTLALPDFVVPRFSGALDEQGTKKTAPPVTKEVEVEVKEEQVGEILETVDENDLLAQEETELIEKKSSVTSTIAQEEKETETETVAAEAVALERVSPTVAATLAAVKAAASTEDLNEIETEEKELGLMKKNETEATSDDFLAVFKETGLLEEKKSSPLPTIVTETEPLTTKVAPPILVAATDDKNQSERNLALSYNTVDRSLANREEREKDVKFQHREELENNKATTPVVVDNGDDDLGGLSFFKPKTETPVQENLTSAKVETKKSLATTESLTVKHENEKKSNKKGSIGQFFKKFFLFLLIFVTVIALGIGVGLLILKLSGKDFFNEENLPTPEPTLLPTPVPVEIIPVSSESAQASKSANLKEEAAAKVAVNKLKILVVNATGIAGYAGETKTALEKDGFVGVKTGNAKGTYDDTGVFVLMADKDTAIIKTLETASGKTLTYDEDYQIEDANGAYDAVIVLNDKK